MYPRTYSAGLNCSISGSAGRPAARFPCIRRSDLLPEKGLSARRNQARCKSFDE